MRSSIAAVALALLPQTALAYGYANLPKFLGVIFAVCLLFLLGALLVSVLVRKGTDGVRNPVLRLMLRNGLLYAIVVGVVWFTREEHARPPLFMIAIIGAAVLASAFFEVVLTDTREGDARRRRRR